MIVLDMKRIYPCYIFKALYPMPDGLEYHQGRLSCDRDF